MGSNLRLRPVLSHARPFAAQAPAAMRDCERRAAPTGSALVRFNMIDQRALRKLTPGVP